MHMTNRIQPLWQTEFNYYLNTSFLNELMKWFQRKDIAKFLIAEILRTFLRIKMKHSQQ